jgi:hypothetical protein
MDAAVAGANFSGLGLALLLRDSGSSLVAELVFKPFTYSPEASSLMASHLQVSTSHLEYLRCTNIIGPSRKLLQAACLALCRSVMPKSHAKVRCLYCLCWPQVFLSQLVCAGHAGSLQPLLHVPLMDKAEEQLVLKGFNENQTRPYDSTTFVHGMFADAVKRHPEAPCVIFEGAVYSYAEVCP